MVDGETGCLAGMAHKRKTPVTVSTASEIPNFMKNDTRWITVRGNRA